jgi:hypothetical protein
MCPNMCNQEKPTKFKKMNRLVKEYLEKTVFKCGYGSEC